MISLLVDVLEQPLTRQLMTATYQAREALVIDDDFMLGPALAAKTKQQAPVTHEFHMAIAQGG